MATIVHGNDRYTLVELAACSSAGEDPSYPSAWHRVPFAGETGSFKRTDPPESREISRIGAATDPGYGPGWWSGELTTCLYYNAIFQHILLCQAMGGTEGLVQDKSPTNHATGANIGNTHYYVPQSFRQTAAGSVGAMTFGIALRIWKAGPINTGGSIEKMLNVYVTGVRFSHDENGNPIAIWSLEGGSSPVVLSATGVTPNTAQASLKPVLYGDLSKDPAHPKTPSGFFAGLNFGAAQLDRYEITMRNGIQWVKRRNLTSLDDPMTAGHSGQVSVEASFAARLQQSDLTPSGALAGTTYFEMLSPAVRSFARLRYISAPSGASDTEATPMVEAATNLPYVLQIDLPLTVPQSAQAPVASGDAVVYEWTRRTIRGPVAGQGAVASPTNWRVPLHVQMFQKITDVADAKVNPTATGGNDPHTSLQ